MTSKPLIFTSMRKNICALISKILVVSYIFIGGVVAESSLLSVRELKEMFLKDEKTFAYNDLDGKGVVSFWIEIDKSQIAVLSFEWSVRPNARPRLERAILIKDGDVTEIQPQVFYDSNELKGIISTTTGKYEIQVKRSNMILLDGWDKYKSAFDFHELELLINKTPIKFSKPK